VAGDGGLPLRRRVVAGIAVAHFSHPKCLCHLTRQAITHVKISQPAACLQGVQIDGIGCWLFRLAASAEVGYEATVALSWAPIL
jgi:hypothetical protein